MAVNYVMHIRFVACWQILETACHLRSAARAPSMNFDRGKSSSSHLDPLLCLAPSGDMFSDSANRPALSIVDPIPIHLFPSCLAGDHARGRVLDEEVSIGDNCKRDEQQ